MSRKNFDNLYNEVLKKAETFLSAPADEELLKKYKQYSYSIKQIVQIIDSMEDRELVRPELDNLLSAHKKVEDRLVTERDNVFKKIRSTLCREHLKNKYYSESISRTLVDKKS